MFAYGFEDLTGAEWSLLEALAGAPRSPSRCRTSPAGRPSRRSSGRPKTSPRSPAASRSCRPARPHAPPALAHLERALFDDDAAARAAALEGVDPLPRGRRRAARSSSSARRSSRWSRRDARRADRARLPVARALARAARDGVRHARDPVRVRGAAPARRDALRPGAAGAAALRLARRRPSRPLRPPALAVLRLARRTSTSSRAGCAAAPSTTPRAGRGRDERCATGAAAGARDACVRRRRSPRAPWARRRCSARRTASRRRRPARRARPTCGRTRRCAGARRARRLVGAAASRSPRGRLLAALERTTARSRARRGGRVAVLDLLRARTRRFEAVFVLGLEEGSLPRRAGAVAVPRRRRAPAARRAARGSPGRIRVSRDRYLFYTACTRATRRLYLVREAATDEGSPREPSPFWDEVARRSTRTTSRAGRAGGALRAHLAAREAPTERERLRASPRCVRPTTPADALALANGWERRLERRWRVHAADTASPPARARRSSARGRRSTSPSSSASRLLLGVVRRALPRPEDDRRRGRREAPRLGRAHGAAPLLRRPAEGARRRAGRPRSASRTAVAFMRTCLEEALEGVRLDMTELQRHELEREPLARPRAGRPRRGALETPLVPRRFEVSFGSERSAPELQRGLELGDGLTLAGRSTGSTSTRSARAGSSRTTRPASTRTRRARSRASCGCRSRSTCSCCATSSGSSRSAASTARSPASASRAGCSAPTRATRRCRASRQRLPRRRRRSGARSTAREDRRSSWPGGSARGDVGTTRRAASAPSWCDLWPMCRVKARDAT